MTSALGSQSNRDTLTAHFRDGGKPHVTTANAAAGKAGWHPMQAVGRIARIMGAAVVGAGLASAPQAAQARHAIGHGHVKHAASEDVALSPSSPFHVMDGYEIEPDTSKNDNMDTAAVFYKNAKPFRQTARDLGVVFRHAQNRTDAVSVRANGYHDLLKVMPTINEPLAAATAANGFVNTAYHFDNKIEVDKSTWSDSTKWDRPLVETLPQVFEQDNLVCRDQANLKVLALYASKKFPRNAIGILGLVLYDGNKIDSYHAVVAAHINNQNYILNNEKESSDLIPEKVFFSSAYAQNTYGLTRIVPISIETLRGYHAYSPAPLANYKQQPVPDAKADKKTEAADLKAVAQILAKAMDIRLYGLTPFEEPPPPVSEAAQDGMLIPPPPVNATSPTASSTSPVKASPPARTEPPKLVRLQRFG